MGMSRRQSMNGPLSLPITEDPAIVSIGRSHVLLYAKVDWCSGYCSIYPRP